MFMIGLFFLMPRNLLTNKNLVIRWISTIFAAYVLSSGLFVIFVFFAFAIGGAKMISDLFSYYQLTISVLLVISIPIVRASIK